MLLVPVVDNCQKPLMPTTANRAASWIKLGKATAFWKRGIFCVRLNIEPSGRQKQDIAVGVDPGSKKEGVTAKSAAHTFLNLQLDAVTWVSDAVRTRGQMRRARRSRKTPCRLNRSNRGVGERLPPSTRARWGWKIRIATWLSKMYPITVFVVEDIATRTRSGQPKFNKSFSPLEVGKTWFYAELAKIAPVKTKQGYETKALRDQLGLKKSKAKLAETFSAHCIDSWVLANWFIGGHTKPDNESILLVTPLGFYRRQLHKLQPARGGIRIREGSTRTLGFTRGSLVTHPKHGLTYVGGHTKDRITLHSLETAERICRSAKPEQLTFKTFNTWRTRFLSAYRLVDVRARTLRAVRDG